MEEFKNLKRVALNELRLLDEAYAGKDQFSESDCKRYDALTHALKSHLTAEAMLKAEEEHNENGMSERRGRAANGQYVSRDGMPDPGYSQGFRDGVNAMSEPHALSGGPYHHYPYTPRNWY